MRLELLGSNGEQMPCCDAHLFVVAPAVHILKVLQGNRKMLCLGNALAKNLSLLG